jgi:hypothetical protein
MARQAKSCLGPPSRRPVSSPTRSFNRPSPQPYR